MLAQNASVPILQAAELAGVDVTQIRRWAEIDGLEIQRRGAMEVVRLDRVMALSASARRRDPNSARGALRARLADAAFESTRMAELRQVGRERDAAHGS